MTAVIKRKVQRNKKDPGEKMRNDRGTFFTGNHLRIRLRRFAALAPNTFA